MIEVALIAPVRAYRDALASCINSSCEFEVVAHGSSPVDVISMIAPRQTAVTLVDFAVGSVVSVVLSVRRDAPGTHVLGFGIQARRDHSEAVIRAAEAGMAGFVDADQSVEDVIGAVRLALCGQSPCSPRIAALLLQAMQRRPTPPAFPAVAVPSGGRGPALTPRERTVADLAALGLTNRQIASRLVLGESTVKTHIHSILGKLGLEHRDQIATRVAQLGTAAHLVG